MNAKRKSNCKKIINYIKKHGSITVDIAREELGIRRASARIYDLRESGHEIKTTMLQSKNDRYAIYTL